MMRSRQYWETQIESLRKEIAGLRCEDREPSMCGAGRMGCSSCMKKHCLTNEAGCIRYYLGRDMCPGCQMADHNCLCGHD